MIIIQTQAQSNGAHANQNTTTPLTEIPEGWAVIPEDMEIPNTFPFINITVDGQVVTSISPGVVPESESEPKFKPEPTAEQDLMNMAVDHELRLSMLELGV